MFIGAGVTQSAVLLLDMSCVTIQVLTWKIVAMFLTAVSQTAFLHQYFHRCFVTGMAVSTLHLHVCSYIYL